jgi:hypothetical protein
MEHETKKPTYEELEKELADHKRSRKIAALIQIIGGILCIGLLVYGLLMKYGVI